MNGKKVFLIIIGFLIVVLTIIIWAYFNREEEVINESNEITPQEEISDEQLRNTIVSLYYINEETNEIEIERRLIDAKILLNNPYEQLFDLWLKGPNSNNLKTFCSENIKINNIELINDCLKIDFSSEFINEFSGNSGTELNLIYCLVNTFTELTEINCIQILIDGQENQYLGNINLSEKYYKTNN